MNILMSLMMVSMVFVMITMSEASARRIAEVIEEKSTCCKLIRYYHMSAKPADKKDAGINCTHHNR